MIVTSVGIVIPTMTELYEKKLNSFKTVRPDIRESDSNLIIALLKYDAAQEYEMYLQLLSQYNNLSIMTATGNHLNTITSTRGMSWRDATRSSGTVIIKGTAGVQIPQAFGVETADGKKYVTQNTTPVEIGTSEELEIGIIAIDVGSKFNTSSRTITKMTTVISGITEIYNPLSIENGKDREKDSELRTRYLTQIQKKANFTTRGIEEYLLNNTDITACRVFENDSDVTVDGRLPHSYEAVIKDGTEDIIFKALYDYKIAGIRCVGQKTKQYGSITVGYTPAEAVELGVRVVFEEMPQDADVERIKSIIQTYIEKSGFGDTIYRYIVVGEIYKLQLNNNIVDIQLGEKGDVQNSDYTIDMRKVGVIALADIEIQSQT